MSWFGYLYSNIGEDRLNLTRNKIKHVSPLGVFACINHVTNVNLKTKKNNLV